jgi:DNA polymerase (family X)
MPVPNSEVARIFDEYADLLEIQGANEYRVRAYRTASRNISYLSQRRKKKSLNRLGFLISNRS